MKKHVLHSAFSLVELMVVVALIAILSGVLMVSFSGGADSARTAKCLSNLKSLAAACQTYGVDAQRYPLAGSIEYSTIDDNSSFRDPKKQYKEINGWVSWQSQSSYPAKSLPTAHVANNASSMYVQDKKKALYSLTNGVLWKYVSGNRDVYLCSLHQKKLGLTYAPVWSYLMNANFGWDYSQGKKTVGDIRTHYGDLQRADKILLFAEVPFSDVGTWQPSVGSSTETDQDGVLQYDTTVEGEHGLQGKTTYKGPVKETIGVNHRSGKNLVAPVVFADGHTEKLVIPFTGSLKNPIVTDSKNLSDLTAWLCIGQDVSFGGTRYKKITE